MDHYPIQQNKNENLRLLSQGTLLADRILPELVTHSRQILDIGCGSGTLIESLSTSQFQGKYTGIDLSPIAIEEAKRQSAKGFSVDLVVSDAIEWLKKCPANSFDLVVIRLVLWSTKHREALLKLANKALKPNGKIYCFEPDDQLLIFYPEKPQLQKLIQTWRDQLRIDGIDPFVGRKLPLILFQSGFEEISITPYVKSYTWSHPTSYKSAIENLWNIFSSKGPAFFGHAENSPEWEEIHQEALQLVPGSFLNEGYFTIVGQKRGD